MAEKKTITLDLTRVDWNAFALMWAFQKQARREWRQQEEIDDVIKEAKDGDYEHLIGTLEKHCE